MACDAISSRATTILSVSSIIMPRLENNPSTRMSCWNPSGADLATHSMSKRALKYSAKSDPNDVSKISPHLARSHGLP